MPTNGLPPEFIPACQMVGGFLLFLLGVSYGYKFFQASIMGKMTYWAGLETFGFWFIPVTLLVTPLLVHTPPKDKNLIRTKTAGWIHLIWGPVFFLLSLMMMVAGADFMKLPGTKVMNFVLTAGQPGVPQAIVYQPPFTYKFPLLKKARRKLFRLLTTEIAVDKKKVLNQFEKEGRDVKGYKRETEEEEEAREEEEERLQAQQQAQQAH